MLELYADGWAFSADHLLREDAAERRSANGEHDEEANPSTAADEQRDDNHDGDGNDHGTAPKPCDNAHRVVPCRGAVVHEPASDFEVESGRTIGRPNALEQDTQYDDERERDGHSQRDASQLMDRGTSGGHRWACDRRCELWAVMYSPPIWFLAITRRAALDPGGGMISLLGNWAKSFRCAGRGVWLAGQARNLRIMLGVFLAVIVLAAIYDVSATRWAALLICGCVVLSGETLNTSIETLVDYVQHECDGDIRTIKDLAAGAVLLTAELAGAVGVIVFWPYVIG
jgi:undecaprenol kinase